MKTRKTNFKVKCFLVTGIFFLSLSAKSQIDLSANHNLLIEYEVFHDFSLRYEKAIFVKEKFLVSGYVGLSSNLFLFNKYKYRKFGIPIGFNMIFGKSKNHFETGVGYLWENHSYQLDYPDKKFQTNFYQLKIGYRYQKLKESSFIFKIGVFTSLEGKTNEPRDVVYSRIIDRLYLGPYIGLGYGF